MPSCSELALTHEEVFCLSCSCFAGLRNILLQGLLDISKLDAGAVKVFKETVELNGLLEGVVEEFRPLATQRGLTISYTPLGPSLTGIETDRELMLRILNNLVSNALKFTRIGGVTVYARPAPPDACLPRPVVIGVVDTGTGIPNAECEKVFEEFYQVGNSSRDRGEGLGLGLSIVKRTAQLLGCPLKLQSEVGLGTRVEITLPGRTGDVISERIPRRLTWPELAGASVLVIDDESEILISINSLLEHLGCRTSCVADLAAANQHLDEGFVPHVLLVDYRLRVSNGLEAILRLQQRLGKVPAVLVTGDTLPDVLQQARLNGIQVLHKPVDGNQLAESMSRLMVRSISVYKEDDS